MFSSSNTVKSDFDKAKDQLQNSTHDLGQEFKSFLCDIENLIKETATLTGEDLAKAKVKITQRIEAAKKSAGESGSSLMQQACKTAKVANKYAHDQPWVIIGAGAALTFLLGYLLSSRD